MPEPESEKASGLGDICRRRDWINLSRCLAAGCTVNQRDHHGLTPLQICSALGWTEAVLLLLKHGADVNQACPLGWTPLMQAVRNGQSDVVGVLIKAGADVSMQNVYGWDSMSLAVESTERDSMAMLMPLADSSGIFRALARACQLGKIEDVSYLLNHQANVNGKLPDSGLTPLMLAACGGHTEVVKVLLASAANVHMTNSSNLTALDMALINGHNDVGVLLTPPPTISFMKASSLSPHPPFHSLALPQWSPYGMPLNPCTPAYHTPSVGPHSPQIFKFPPSPTCACTPFNCTPYISPHQSPAHLSPYLMAHSPRQCVSPTACSSPLVPPWLFSYGHCYYKVEPKFKLESRKILRRWWKKLKRRFGKKRQHKNVGVYVSVHGHEAKHSDPQLEALLHSLNLESLSPLLKSHEIDVDTFLNLRQADLEELGIVDKAFQFFILQRIRSLNNNL
ncbi:ankyrin repeat domain-containing protein 17-like [Thrips palmi]|uniref:NAD(+) ADP-ribosyltransferase n=1 Tax=Thrips palmi TaxID=161013 RepID=A0A6P8Z5T3_THRPL|nr:ankyrin repeat domain-containing protein 17-like [Thrips palmi]